jgi:uncharacterized protein DUF2332
VQDTAELYRRFARVEASGESPTYERLALAVARDDGALALLGAVAPRCRQPNLLFGALRLLGVPLDDPSWALGWLRAHPESVLEVLRTRRTQTNEVGRCALHVPVLAALPQPLALVEVGASAGLCLLPDRWRYHYTGPGVARTVGAGPVTVACTVDGPVPLPPAPPVIAWRAGLDLHPVDAADPDARRWLRCLVWPEHRDRATRLDSALRVAAAAAPRIARGHLVDDLPALLRQTPAERSDGGRAAQRHAHLRRPGRAIGVPRGRRRLWGAPRRL